MDSSTVIFIVTLLIAFVFLRWFIDSEEEDLDNLSSNSQPQRQQQQQQQQRRQNRRPVTTDMVEVVQSIAPHLSTGQIVLDLEQTGSVQATVDRILSGAELPHPSGQSDHATTIHANGTANGPTSPQASDERNRTNNIKPENLLEKFGVDANQAASSGADTKPWSIDSDERHLTLQEKKAAMVLKARKRLEAQLRNEQNLSGLEK